MKEECAFTNLDFPVVLLTADERRILTFWCPRTLALIDETNRLELVELWNSTPMRPKPRRWGAAVCMGKCAA